jgi:low temperature requirement protein LtrA
VPVDVVVPAATTRRRRLGASAPVVTGTRLRQRGQVTPLELFFDLVFVLAITQCTTLMVDEHSWEGLAKGLLVLAALWWSWVGYAWLTSVVDPEEGVVRLAMFAAMAGFLVVALAIPEAFEDLGVTFAVAYGVVRAAQVLLLWVAGADDPRLRRSVVTGLAGSTGVGVGLIAVASQLDGAAQGALWVLAIALDVAGPFFFGSEGWKLEPEHFAERHRLIVIIALGESIVALGVGSEAGVDGGVVLAAVVGVALAAVLWWLYFDVVTLATARHLAAAPVGKVQNELARDGYSLLHFPMVAGIVLVALGMHETLAHVDEPLGDVVGTAFLGGIALYLLGHVGFARRDHGTWKLQRLVVAGVSLALLPLVEEVDSIVLASAATTLLAVLAAYETVRFAEERDRIRHGDAGDQPIPSDSTV